MFLDNLGDIIASSGVRLDDKAVHRLRVKILQKIEEEGFMKSIIFKHGIFVTIYGLKTYDEVAKKLEHEFLDSFTSGHAPDVTGKFAFSTMGFCMARNPDTNTCRFDDAQCRYFKNNKWTLCEFINEEIGKQ